MADSLEQLLARMPLFAGLPDDALELIAGCVLDRTVKAGKTVIREGNWGHEVVLVLDGTVEVRRGEAVVATLGPGAVVGEVAVLDDSRRNASVVAVTPTAIGAVDYGQFRALLHEIPELAARVDALAAERRPDA